MVDTRKELLLHRESEWSDRQQKNSRTQRKTYKESEVIRETETHCERISERYSDIDMGEVEDKQREEEKEREIDLKAKKLAGYNRRLKEKKLSK